MKVYNTLTRQKEEFIPREEGKVKMYVCGPTVYDYIHIGNARPYVVFDTVRRYLEYKGYDVTYVQNFTDVDDKIINRANKEGSTMEAISNRYIEEAFHDADGLNVKRATVHPRVTQEMDGIIAMVQTLIDKGFAYEDNGTVYYLSLIHIYLKDEQLKIIGEMDGFVGLNFFPPFVAEKDAVTQDDLLRQLTYMLDMAGEDAVGLGSDFDGIDVTPTDLRAVEDMALFLERMEQEFGSHLAEKIREKNFLRVAERVWK